MAWWSAPKLPTTWTGGTGGSAIICDPPKLGTKYANHTIIHTTACWNDRILLGDKWPIAFWPFCGRLVVALQIRYESGSHSS